MSNSKSLPVSKPVKLYVQCNVIVTILTSICGNGSQSSDVASLEVSSKATTYNVDFIRQPSTNFAKNTKIVMACQISDGGLAIAGNFLHFLGIKESVKRFKYIECQEGEAEKKSFEAAKDAAQKQEIESTINYYFDGKIHPVLYH